MIRAAMVAAAMLLLELSCREALPAPKDPSAVLRSEPAGLCTQVHVFKVPVRQNPSSQFEKRRAKCILALSPTAKFHEIISFDFKNSYGGGNLDLCASREL